MRRSGAGGGSGGGSGAVVEAGQLGVDAVLVDRRRQSLRRFQSVFGGRRGRRRRRRRVPVQTRWCIAASATVGQNQFVSRHRMIILSRELESERANDRTIERSRSRERSEQCAASQ